MEKLLTTQEAGKILGVGRLRVRQLISSGRLPAMKFGRDWIISKDDLAKVANRKSGRPKKNSRDSHVQAKRETLSPARESTIRSDQKEV